jgi:hypothetical protein
MATWTGSYTPSAGDTFVLRGCDSWTNSNFPIIWTWSGSSGSPITVGGEDKTWYDTTTCTSWNRPIFDAGSTVISTHQNFIRMVSGGGAYTTWDNIEYKDYTWTGGYGEDAMICTGACSGSITNVSITNSYFHHWNHGSATADGYVILGTTNSPYMPGSLIDSNVIDNTDGDTNSGSACGYCGGTITHNVIVNITNAIQALGGSGSNIAAYNNVRYLNNSFDTTVHENCIETQPNNGSVTPTWYLHDNICHDGAIGESAMLGNNGETDYYWNNLVYNWSGNPPHFAEQSGQTVTALHFWNNTIVPPTGDPCFIEIFSPTIGTLDIQNNHCISTSTLTTSLSGYTTLIENNNLLETPTQADADSSPNFDQYTVSETYAYSPVASTNSTVGYGLNLTSSWPAGYSTNDTSYACTEGTVNGVVQVVCPARTSNTRPPTGAWDAGAYYYGDPSVPSPPSKLTAVVQ